VSLSAHLTAGTADHGRLAFHPDCPRCRAERLAGHLAADPLVSRRAQAALAAGLLAFSAGAPAAAAQVPEPDQQQATEPPAGGEPPGLQPDFDPGGDDTFDYETAPVPGGPEAGGEEDEGLGAPVETEPPTDVEAPPVVEDAPEPPAPQEAAPVPVTEPAPAPAPATPPAPAPPVPSPSPTEPPAGEVEQPAPRPEPRKTTSNRKTPTRAPKAREVQRRPAVGTAPIPPPESAAPVVQSVEAPAPAAPQPAPPTTASVSQSTEPPAGPINGPRYTVRAGDSLWSIARRLLGPDASAGRIAREVNRLWQLNEDRIGTGNPSLIRVGTVLEL
jgi:LysM repeat protein